MVVYCYGIIMRYSQRRPLVPQRSADGTLPLLLGFYGLPVVSYPKQNTFRMINLLSSLRERMARHLLRYGDTETFCRSGLRRKSKTEN